MYNQDKNTDRLIERLYGIMLAELDKPYEQMDADFVEICVELILELQGKNYTLSNEELEEKVSKIPFVEVADFEAAAQKKKKKIKTKKILLIAAIIAVLCALLMVMSSSRCLYYWHGFMNDKFGSVLDMPVDEKYTEGNDEFIYNGNSVIYTSTQDFFENEEYDVLLPDEFPKEIELIEVRIISDDTIVASFNSVISSYEIYLDTTIPQIIKDNTISYITENNLPCYIVHMEDIGSVQIHFEHNGNFYTIRGTDEQILLNIIENLEEYK